MASVYLPVFIMIAVALIVAGAIFTSTSIFGPKNPNPEKMLPYESGSVTQGGTHVRLSVKFYLTAILFVVFDIEAVFLYPWAGLFRDFIEQGIGWLALVEMLLFLLVLGITLLYAWRKGALEWEK
ncbi:MAG: NADH-quinone oxidoreductase subunit A [Myxococcota bacterium]